MIEGNNRVKIVICSEKKWRKKKFFTKKTSIEVRLSLFGYVHDKLNNQC